ncbi:uncharacterized protein [Bombus flavifrons]|uniref:uncharacterized protein n=1 Tax=Bombus flavifrons TaxID=103934 RepID=UPI0037048DA5
MQSRKDKVKDKPPSDPHREYLDAESTDEEERQRKIYEKNIKGHEVDEVQEELRPIYDEQELSNLVNCVKDMTTLGGLRKEDWSYYLELTIREFFLNPNFTTLTIYYLYNRLAASLSFPIVPVYELTYFIREPQEILRADTFRDRVLFGSVNDKVEQHVLSVVQNVLSPIFLKIETWPDSIHPERILARFVQWLNSCLISRGKFSGEHGIVTILQRAELRNFLVSSSRTFFSFCSPSLSFSPFLVNNLWV